MRFIYVLYSKKDGRLYVGCTKNVAERIKRHNYGLAVSTKNRRPLVSIHEENFHSKADAFKRERFLKSLWGMISKTLLRG